MAGGWRKSTRSGVSDCVEVAGWRTSTASSGGSCVEVGNAPAVIAVRDSTDRDGPVLTFRGNTWNAFTRSLKNGQTPAGPRT